MCVCVLQKKAQQKNLLDGKLCKPYTLYDFENIFYVGVNRKAQ